MPGTALCLDNTTQCFICFESDQDGQCEWFSCAYCHNPAHRKCVNSWACSQAKQLVYAGATRSEIQATLVVRCALCKQDSQFNDPDLSDLPDYFTQYLDSDSEEPDSVPSTPGTEPDDFTDLTWEPELDTMANAAPAIIRDYTGTRCMACNIVNDRSSVQSVCCGRWIHGQCLCTMEHIIEAVGVNEEYNIGHHCCVECAAARHNLAEEIQSAAVIKVEQGVHPLLASPCAGNVVTMLLFHVFGLANQPAHPWNRGTHFMRLTSHTEREQLKALRHIFSPNIVVDFCDAVVNIQDGDFQLFLSPHHIGEFLEQLSSADYDMFMGIVSRFHCHAVSVYSEFRDLLESKHHVFHEQIEKLVKNVCNKPRHLCLAGGQYCVHGVCVPVESVYGAVVELMGGDGGGRTVRECIDEFSDGVGLDYEQSRCLAFLMRHEYDDKLDVVRMCVWLESIFGADDIDCDFYLRRCVQLIMVGSAGSTLVDWWRINVELRDFLRD